MAEKQQKGEWVPHAPKDRAGKPLAVGDDVILHGKITRLYEEHGRNVQVLFDAPAGEHSYELTCNEGCVEVAKKK